MSRTNPVVGCWLAGAASALLAACGPGEPAPPSKAAPVAAASSAASSASSATAPRAAAPTPPLDEAIATAFEIRSSAARDEELARLVRVGLAQGDWARSLAAASRVSRFDRRDALLDEVSCHAMHAGDAATVRRAAASAFAPSLRGEIAARVAPAESAAPAPRDATCRTAARDP